MEIQEVKQGEEEDPDKIDEVPEQAADFDAVGQMFGVLLEALVVKAEEVGKNQGADDHVSTVKTGEREVDGVVRVQLRCEVGEEGDVLLLEHDGGMMTVGVTRTACKAFPSASLSPVSTPPAALIESGVPTGVL